VAVFSVDRVFRVQPTRSEGTGFTLPTRGTRHLWTTITRTKNRPNTKPNVRTTDTFSIARVFGGAFRANRQDARRSRCRTRRDDRTATIVFPAVPHARAPVRATPSLQPLRADEILSNSNYKEGAPSPKPSCTARCNASTSTRTATGPTKLCSTSAWVTCSIRYTYGY